MKKKLKLGVLFGGISTEHEVSLASARNVLAAIDREKFEVFRLGITRDGHWVMGDRSLEYLICLADRSLLPAGMEDVLWQASREMKEEGLLAFEIPTDFCELQRLVRSALQEVLAISPERLPSFSQLGNVSLCELDVVFPVLHGLLGEDGCVQGMFRVAGVAVVGCGVLASAVAMDKIVTKKILAQQGIPQVRWLEFTDAKRAMSNLAEIDRQIVEKLGSYPVFVKPADTGSSVGIRKVQGFKDLSSALVNAAKFSRRLLIEEAVVGRELEVGILGDEDELIASAVVAEIIPEREFYDYEAKYLENTTRIDLPANVDSAVVERIGNLAKDAFRAIDGCGMARIDFFYCEDSQEIFLNEINTIPGFTQISMYPRLMMNGGLSYGGLIEKLIEIALGRQAALMAVGTAKVEV
ncbi:MAG: D-alanine--D-alanine ligase [Deltaproteobacteria bacterium]|nr:D-alanine--D-alanine ligase [Deltaproteobacteria bacterium]